MQTSIRFRLTAWYVAALALTLFALGGATYLLTQASLIHWLDETVAERAEALSEQVLARLRWVMAWLVPLALAVAGAGGYALASRALAPVDQIGRAAAAISERDLSRRLPVRARDELGRLAITFNGLIERLQRAFE